MKLKIFSSVMIASLLASMLLVSMINTGSAEFLLGAPAKFYIKLPNGTQWMNVSAAPPYDIGDKFNITVGIANVTEMSAYGFTMAWNATYMNATGNYWLDPYFVGLASSMPPKWSGAMIEYITNDLDHDIFGGALGKPLIGFFCGLGQAALGAKYNITGTFDIVKIEFRINAYGPHGYYIWKNPVNYAPWPYVAGQPYLQQEGTFPAAIHQTYSGWKRPVGGAAVSQNYSVVWCPHPLFAPPTPLSGKVANAVLWIEPPAPYPPEAEKTVEPEIRWVNQTVTVTVTETKPGFNGTATCPITNVTIDWGDTSPLEWEAPVAGQAIFYHNYTDVGDYNINVYCYAAHMPPELAWCNLTNPITVVPEFPAYLLMPLFLTATIIAVAVAKIMWSKKPKGRVNVK